jgi:glycopeptide antibiotics resistance protein
VIYVYNSFYQLFFLIIDEVLVSIACEDTVLVIRLCLTQYLANLGVLDIDKTILNILGCILAFML